MSADLGFPFLRSTSRDVYDQPAGIDNEVEEDRGKYKWVDGGDKLSGYIAYKSWHDRSRSGRRRGRHDSQVGASADQAVLGSCGLRPSICYMLLVFELCDFWTFDATGL